MTEEVGLWMDHREAVIVVVTDEGEKIEKIASNVEKQLRRGGDSPLKGPHEAQLVPADDSRERSLTGHLNNYYDAIIARIRDAESIYILGPGEAKGELKRRMERARMGGRIIGVETADSMTERQVAAKVLERFAR
jgi:hypothetical protein